jgi:hypothetical protein
VLWPYLDSLSVSVSAPYLDFSPQVFYALARYLKLNCQPVERIETDLSLHYPHGHLDDRQAVRMALQLSGSIDPPARDVLFVQQFLQKVVESPEGLLEDEANSQRMATRQRDSSNGETSFWFSGAWSLRMGATAVAKGADRGGRGLGECVR